jgi:hypothetical protein
MFDGRINQTQIFEIISKICDCKNTLIAYTKAQWISRPLLHSGQPSNIGICIIPKRHVANAASRKRLPHASHSFKERLYHQDVVLLMLAFGVIVYSQEIVLQSFFSTDAAAWVEVQASLQEFDCALLLVGQS